MKLQNIIVEFLDNIKITPVAYSDEAFYDSDGYSVWEKAAAIAQNSGIRISSNKELAFVAEDDNEVYGAIWDSFEEDHGGDYGDDVWVYDFDIAVKKTARAKGMRSGGIGVKLIDAALNKFEYLKSDVNRAYIRVWVVNPGLAKWLEYNRNFEPSGVGSDGTGIMTCFI